MQAPDLNSYHLRMDVNAKFDDGDPVQILGGKHEGRLGDIVGLNFFDSLRTYTVKFGDGSDAEIEEALLSKVKD